MLEDMQNEQDINEQIHPLDSFQTFFMDFITKSKKSTVKYKSNAEVSKGNFLKQLLEKAWNEPTSSENVVNENSTTTASDSRIDSKQILVVQNNTEDKSKKQYETPQLDKTQVDTVEVKKEFLEHVDNYGSFFDDIIAKSAISMAKLGTASTNKIQNLKKSTKIPVFQEEIPKSSTRSLDNVNLYSKEEEIPESYTKSLDNLNGFFKDFGMKSLVSLVNIKNVVNEKIGDSKNKITIHKIISDKLEESMRDNTKINEQEMNNNNQQRNFESQSNDINVRINIKTNESMRSNITNKQMRFELNSQEISHISNELTDRDLYKLTGSPEFSQNKIEKNRASASTSLEKKEQSIIKTKNEIEENIRQQKLKEAQAIKKALENRLKLLNEQIDELEVSNSTSPKFPNGGKKLIKLSQEELKEREDKANELMHKIYKERKEKEKRDQKRREKLDEDIKHEIEVAYKNRLEHEEKIKIEKKYEIFERLEQQKFRRMNRLGVGYASYNQVPELKKSENNFESLKNIGKKAITSDITIPELEKKKQELSKLRDLYYANHGLSKEDMELQDKLREIMHQKPKHMKEVSPGKSPTKKIYQSSVLQKVKEQDIEQKLQYQKKVNERKALHDRQVEYGKLLKYNLLPKMDNLKNPSIENGKGKDILNLGQIEGYKISLKNHRRKQKLADIKKFLKESTPNTLDHEILISPKIAVHDPRTIVASYDSQDMNSLGEMYMGGDEKIIHMAKYKNDGADSTRKRTPNVEKNHFEVHANDRLGYRLKKLPG